MKRNHEESPYSTEEIIATIQTLTNLPGSSKEKQRVFRKTHSDFVEKYPTLFQMACEPNFNMDRLVYMLRMRDAVEAQKVSQHQASVSVGENLFQEYVKPLVDANPKK
jgi:hypothetical protein